MTDNERLELTYFDRDPYGPRVQMKSAFIAEQVAILLLRLTSGERAPREPARERDLILRRAASMLFAAGIFEDAGDPRMADFIAELGAMTDKYAPAANPQALNP